MGYITCFYCGTRLDDRDEKCSRCGLPTRKEVEMYNGYPILKYGTEEGYRVDFGTIRSKMVNTLQEARDLIDFPVRDSNEDDV